MMMVAMFAAAIMAVNPVMTVLGPMARHPDHFVVTLPVTRSMAVIWTVTDFDVKSRVSPKRGPESEARRDGREQQCFVNHIKQIGFGRTAGLLPRRKVESYSRDR
jgi:hypothetical protein